MFDTERKLILTVRDAVDKKFNEIDDKIEDMNKKANYGDILDSGANYKPYYRDSKYGAEVDIRNLYQKFEDYKTLINLYDDCCDVLFGIEEKNDEKPEVDEDEYI